MDLHSLPTHLQGKSINEKFGTRIYIYAADILQLRRLFFEKNIYLGNLKAIVENLPLTHTY